MVSSEKYCLRWNDFGSSLSGSFSLLRKQAHFLDVSLACQEQDVDADEDGDEDRDCAMPVSIRAHRVVLSACSPLFKRLLCEAASAAPGHPNPVLFLRGVSHRFLGHILDFMYDGEVNVAQSDLKAFLAVAEDLQVRGLAQRSKRNRHDEEPGHTNKRVKVEEGGDGGDGDETNENVVIGGDDDADADTGLAVEDEEYVFDEEECDVYDEEDGGEGEHLQQIEDGQQLDAIHNQGNFGHFTQT